MGQRGATREAGDRPGAAGAAAWRCGFRRPGHRDGDAQPCRLKGYRTGGTIHIIINNQIGFTTSPEAGRSTIYSTDVARMTQLPIFHINGDDPEAAYRVLQIALDYRQEFNKDVVLDVVGFRRLGHNETDEPSYTQPLMYARVKAHPGVRTFTRSA